MLGMEKSASSVNILIASVAFEEGIVEINNFGQGFYLSNAFFEGKTTKSELKTRS